MGFKRMKPLRKNSRYRSTRARREKQIFSDFAF
jgi:hypothetical protein